MAVAVTLLGTTATARPHKHSTSDRTPLTCDGKSLVHHQHRARALIRKAYDLSRWRDPSPVKAAEKRAWQQHRRCIDHPPTRFAISAYRDKQAAEFERRRKAQLSDCIPGVTVYSLGTQCLAIPGYIVACESHGDWGAYNPSGAAGIYQIMAMHGRPWPVDSVADKRAHHRIAARLWNGGAGASNWVCA